MTLHKLQSALARTIIAADAPDETLHATLAGDNIEKRLDVYRNNYSTGLHDILCAAYPALHTMVGRDFMATLTRPYIRAIPPQTADMNAYGAAFADFIATDERLHATHYLPDLARLEWAFHLAGFAQDDEAWDENHACAALSAERPLRLRTSSFLGRSRWPVTALHRYAQDPANCPPPHIVSADCFWLVCRPALDTVILEIDQPTFAALDACQHGMTLQTMAEDITTQYATFDLVAFLQFVLLHRICAA